MIPLADALMLAVLHSTAAKPDPAPRVDVASRSIVRSKPVTVRPQKPARTSHIPVGGWAAGDWSRFPAWIEASAQCIARHESWHAGLWTARNPSSSASGAFQFVDGTWRAMSARAGLSGWSRAYLAPPRVQAAVFAFTARNYGLSPWAGTHCPGT